MVGELTTHFRTGILVVGLGCSLGVRAFDPWPRHVINRVWVKVRRTTRNRNAGFGPCHLPGQDILGTYFWPTAKPLGKSWVPFSFARSPKASSGRACATGQDVKVLPSLWTVKFADDPCQRREKMGGDVDTEARAHTTTCSWAHVDAACFAFHCC